MVAAGVAQIDQRRLETFVHDQFRALVLSNDFPCLAAHSALRQNHYRFRLYESLGTAAAARTLLRDLRRFEHTRRAWSTGYATFIAAFEGPVSTTEPEFEDLLWRQLQTLHDLDPDGERWDPRVSSDPTSPEFSYSVGGQAYFIVGLHPGSSRYSRRFAWPTLCFNAHEQFEQLRLSHHFERMSGRVRARDTALQGMPNPMLAEYGAASEARQYSGRSVGGDWRCPFDPGPVSRA